MIKREEVDEKDVYINAIKRKYRPEVGCPAEEAAEVSLYKGPLPEGYKERMRLLTLVFLAISDPDIS